MANGVPGMSWARHGAVLLSALTTLAAGCASEEGIREAMTDINREFQAQYERILAEQGVRAYKIRRTEAFVALHAAMSRLGMRIDSHDPELGFLNVHAPAPRPLSVEEWRKAAQADLPRMQEIASRHVGPASSLITFEPEGLDIVITATTVEASAGTEVSLTMRLRETAPPRSGMPRREYPPPTGLRIGLDKIWAQFESELRAAKRIP